MSNKYFDIKIFFRDICMLKFWERSDKSFTKKWGSVSNNFEYHRVRHHRENEILKMTKLNNVK